MAGVDNKIVSMQFDNQQFQQRISETLSSLDKLKGGLDFANSTRGMQELSTTAGRFSLGNMAEQIAGVSAGFVALGTVAVTTLMNITNRAIDAGIAFAKSITTAPIMQGFQEFELKMGSIQTIMSGSGASLEVVNQKLQELNEYSDKTIYSFKDMTSNIGKFTNAGVSLDDSVAAIQGVANVAALSGANSEEASRAMYNFSQALAAGSVKAVDWRSIELANMGTVEFKQQLIDSAEAMGTLTKQGDGWVTSAGTFVSSTKGFRESLAEGWLTSEALTDTLGNFSDVTTDVGKRATAAATEVKTFSMMINTMKESVGSGWATTFETIFGNFEEGKALWTSINDAFTNTVGASADARNAMLKSWKELGGRDVLLEGFTNAAKALGNVITPIKEAFRDIFPAMTAERLMGLTESFRNFTERLIIGESTMAKVKSAFSGVFSVLSIGWEVIKGVAGVFGDLFGSVAGGSGGLLTFSAGVGDTVTAFRNMLVEGGGIKRFFENISNFIKNPIEAFEKIQEVIADLINDFPGFSGAADVASGVAARLGDRFEGAANLVRKLGDAAEWVGDRLSGIIGVLDTVWGHITTWMGELKDKLADLWAPSDFDGAVDAVGVGLLGGLALMLRNFFKNGFNIDFFTGGMMEKITDALDGVTGALRTMQADLRAKALMKIAIAMGVLTVSIVALSLIDSAKLAKALAAIAVGFAQLVGVMMLLERASLGTSAVRLGGLATGMILVAGAAVVLSIAIKNLSSLGWEELAKGLIGVGGGLAIMITGMNMLTTNTSGMVRAGIGMVAMSVGLLALSYAVKSFSDLSWGEMAKGMVGVGVGLGLLVGAMNLMPVGGLVSAGIGMIAISAGLIILAEAVKEFAEISWGEMLKGMVGIGAGLVIIAGAMHLMPLNLPITAAGMVILSAALIVLSQAVKMLGGIPLGELAKGLGALAIMLGILAVAMIAMTGTAAGAAATLIAAGALVVLTGVLKTLGKMSLGELAMGLGAIAAVLAVLGIAAALMTPVVPVLMSLGWALLLIGGAFALFGAGAMLMAKAFEVIAQAGKKGLGVLIEMIEMVIAALPGFISAFVQALISLATELLGAVGPLVKVFQALIAQILETVIELVPQIVEALGVIITGFLTLVREKVPEVIETGIAILMAILTGIRDNIGEIVTVVAEIITGFLDALAEKVPEIIDSVYNLIVAIFTGVVAKLVDVGKLLVPKGVELIGGLLSGIVEKAVDVLKWFTQLPLDILKWIGDVTKTVFQKGIDFISGLLDGIVKKAVEVTSWFTSLAGDILKWIGDVTKTVFQKGIDFITGLLTGIVQKAAEVISWFTSLAGAVLGWIGNVVGTLTQKGIDFLLGLFNGILEKYRDVRDWFANLGSMIKSVLSNFGSMLLESGKDLIRGLWNGILAMKDWIISKVSSVGGWISAPFKAALDILSPSKVFYGYGVYIAEGLINGLDQMQSRVEETSESVGKNVVSGFQKTLSDIHDQMDLGSFSEFNPTITPVLDLTKVKMEAKNLDGMMAMASISPTVSADRARQIATTAETAGTDQSAPAYSGPQEVTFEQNIYSPSALSTNDIYRNTKSQIALAKEELNI